MSIESAPSWQKHDNPKDFDEDRLREEFEVDPVIWTGSGLN